MSVIQKIRKATAIALTNLYQLENVENFIQINTTKPEFEGDYTIVLFSLVKQLRKSPELIGKELG
ncbi:MAG TPA: arginine--tRNA ligase, partial [Parasegetibacter sp.]